MRTNRYFQCLLLSGALFLAGRVVGQVSTLGNSGGSTDYLGWDNTNNFPLQVRHDGNQPIDWYTQALHRMRLTQTLVNQNWAWYQQNNLDFSGHLGIGSATASNSPATRTKDISARNSAGMAAPGKRTW